MRLRTLPLSMSGVVCGGVLGYAQGICSLWTLIFLFATTIALQVLSNLSNEMGDHLSGVDGANRQGPSYGLTEGGLTEHQLWQAINGSVVVCCVAGLAMVLLSFGNPLHRWQPIGLIVLGAAAIWAATHYTLGKRPYGYRGLGDLFVFLFFGIVSVMGSYYVTAHRLNWSLLWPACGIGLLSVGVLNVNNIRDMATDAGLRRTVPLRLGLRRARIYHTALVVGGYLLLLLGSHSWWPVATAAFVGWHLYVVWHNQGRQLDPALPMLVLTTFATALLYTIGNYGL